jgi:flavin-dependent dehydrogenase
VGILSTNRIHTGLQARLAEYLQAVGITQVERTEKHGYLIPLAPRPGALARGRVLLAGDAAGLVDPVMAEGISHAILSGQLAAAALIENRLEPAKVAASYQALLEEKILRELRAGRLLARILYHHPRVRHCAFRLGGRKLCEFVTGVVMGGGSYHEALRKTASYLKFLGLKK